MSRNTLIPESLLCDMYRLLYYLDGVSVPDEAKALCASIEAVVLEIINRRAVRNAFSAYKTAPPGPLRESLRQEYIRLSHIPCSFVSAQEVPLDLL